jgi:hypothetical protein
MKTIAKLAITGLTTALLTTGAAFADNSEWATFSTGNATVTYRRPTPEQATVALKVHSKAIGRANAAAKSSALRSISFQTANGPVSYFAPAE